MRELQNKDVRIQRTRKLLIQALTELLNEKTFDEIRVKDICQRAGVHRSTFYDHFEDKLHLLTYGIQDLMDILISPSTDNLEKMQHAIYRIFKFFKLNQQEYTLLFLDPRNAAAKNLFQTEFGRALRQAIMAREPKASMEEVRAHCLFFTGGLFSVLTWWLEHDTQPPARQIAAHFMTMVWPCFQFWPDTWDED